MKITNLAVGHLVLVLGNLVGFFSNTLWSDDFSFLVWSRQSFELNSNLVVANGRPVLALGNHLMFKLVDSSGSTIVPHLFAVLFLLTLYRSIINSFLDEERSRLAIPLSMGLLTPPFLIYTNWTSVWLYNLAALLGVYGWKNWQAKKKVRSLTLLVLGFLIYPTATLLFLVIFPIQLAVRKSIRTDEWKRLLNNLILVIMATILAVVVNLTLFAVGLMSPAERLRVADFLEIPEKSIWFLSRSILASLQFVSVVSPSLTLILLIHVPILLLIVMLLRNLIRDYEKLPTIICISTLSIAIAQFPHIVGSERQIEFRFLPASSLLFTVIFFVVSIEIFSRTRRVNLANLFIIVFCLIGVVVNNVRVLDFYARQFNDKEKFFSLELKSCNNISSVFLSSSGVSLENMQRIGTFSQQSDLQSGWVAPNFIEYRYGIKPLIASELENTEIAAERCLVDMTKFKPSEPFLRF